MEAVASEYGQQLQDCKMEVGLESDTAEASDVTLGIHSPVILKGVSVQHNHDMEV